LAPKANEVGEVMQNNGHYAVQGHSRSPISVPVESPFATFYICVNDGSLTPIVHRFRNMAHYWSSYRPRQGRDFLTQLME